MKDFKPLNNKVLVREIVDPEPEGLILAPRGRSYRGTVINVGEKVEDIKVGDEVFYRHTALETVRIGEETFLVLNRDADIYGIV